ncbi:hypothetical protein [Bacillus massiliigorillae]|uniref:hypothetical protein n=1 Tax=Bacillus massiliigorillae TaxID=1243664 RepID=UPI0005AB49E4|nr:hypothetical protein [Bacillus massiliigorillae]
MKLSHSYPYPVLQNENDDYRKSSFIIDYHVATEFGELKVEANCILSNEGIKGLIASNAAVYMIHIECGQTSYRRVFKTVDTSIQITIPANLLRGKVTVHSFIVATTAISNYTNELLNDWYKGLDIRFEKGNFLAIGNAIEMTLFEENTEFLNLPSIVNIQKAVKGEFMEVDIHSNLIIISLPTYEYDQYAGNANSRLKNTILSMIIVPCLTEVFSKINEYGDDLKEYTWYQVMEKIFTDNNYRFEDVGTDKLSSLKAAQLVLRKPFKSSFEEIEKMNKLED